MLISNVLTMLHIEVITTKPVATDSPDHLEPWGTARDNSVNKLFNFKLFLWLGRNIQVLDLGCAGGGFIESMVKRGNFAVGIEGSDYSKKMKRAAWGIIPENLFTADITEPFLIREAVNSNQIRFDVITAWEVLEHISENKIQAVIKNIEAHLKPQGIVIMSVSTKEDIVNHHRLHQTIKSKKWWLSIFRELGFKNYLVPKIYFSHDWIRGEGIDDPSSFNVVLSRDKESLPRSRCLLLIATAFTLFNFGHLIIKKISKFLKSHCPQSIKSILRSIGL